MSVESKAEGFLNLLDEHEDELVQHMVSIVKLSGVMSSHIADSYWKIFSEMKKKGFSDKQAFELTKLVNVTSGGK